jgi:hypothetical protein
MPPELPNNQQPYPRRRAIEVISRAQEDALRQLREARVPEAQALAVMERITAFSLQTLRALDALYLQFDDIVAEEGRGEAHQQRLNDKAAVLLLQVEQAIAALVAEAIRKAIHEPDDQPEQPREVITVPAKPAQSPWEQFLRNAPRHLVWLIGIAVWILIVWQATGQSAVLTAFGVMIALVAWGTTGSSWWSVLLPIIAVGVPVFIFLL